MIQAVVHLRSDPAPYKQCTPYGIAQISASCSRDKDPIDDASKRPCRHRATIN